jgi:hypothetical protein
VNVRITVLCLCIALLGAACGTSEAAPALTETPPAAVTSLADIPAAEDPIVTVRPSEGEAVGLDLAGLDQLRQVELTIYEPFEEGDVTFSGVVVSDLLSLFEADEVGTAQFLALDDYEVELSLADVSSSGVVLATRQDGKEIAIEDGGPTRLVFPDGSEVGRNTDLWVWSLKHITLP